MGVDWCQGFLELPADHSDISFSDQKTSCIFYIQPMLQTGQSVQKLYRFQEK